MKRRRKMLGRADSPQIIALASRIETLSKPTAVSWCLACCRKEILPIYRHHRSDFLAEEAINSAERWMRHEIRLPEARRSILALHAAAREMENDPAGQAAARAIAQSASSIHCVRHALGLFLYGAAAIAYERCGTGLADGEYERIAEEECSRMLDSLPLESIAED